MSDDEEIFGKEQWVSEAKAVIEDIKPHVTEAVLSDLEGSDTNVYINITTKENRQVTVEMSTLSFKVVDNCYNSCANPEEKGFQTHYELLYTISPGYRTSYSKDITLKLLHVQERLNYGEIPCGVAMGTCTLLISLVKLLIGTMSLIYFYFSQCRKDQGSGINCHMPGEEVFGKEQWVSEAKAVIEDIKPHVTEAVVSDLEGSDNEVFINLTTKEDRKLTIEMSAQGFKIVDNCYNSRANPEEQWYHSHYALLNKISREYRASFSKDIIMKLMHLKLINPK